MCATGITHIPTSKGLYINLRGSYVCSWHHPYPNPQKVQTCNTFSGEQVQINELEYVQVLQF